MAGPRAMLPVPGATRSSRTPGAGVRMPMSTGNTSARAARAMQHTEVSPRAMFPATSAVTSCPVCVTPSSTTPLSAQNTTTARRSSEMRALPEIPANPHERVLEQAQAPHGLGDGVPARLRGAHRRPVRQGDAFVDG